MTQQDQYFTEQVWDYYHRHGRHDLPWRQNTDTANYAYFVLVSEIMLQQTQVSRVIPAFQAWIARFPDITSVAQATRADCIMQWSGLGYNRRAKYLHDSCSILTANYGGIIPRSTEQLTALPGIGSNTAGAIVAYSYNMPTTYIETNIRTVYLYHYFSDELIPVADSQLVPIIKRTVDKEHPREWYWALMDYGSHLKKTVGNISKNSKHYAKQSKFEGSLRQLRGKVVARLSNTPTTFAQLEQELNDARLPEVIAALEKEGILEKTEVALRLSGHRDAIL